MTWLRRGNTARDRRPVWHPVVAALSLVGFLAASAPDTTLALSCGTQDRYFQGTVENRASTKGGQAKIAYVNESVCTPVPSGQGAFSSYWVAVVGYDSGDPDGLNIYQIGVDKCRAAACPSGNPSNTPYYFYAYGRMDSASCGPAIGPAPVEVSGTPSGLRTYTIVRESAPNGYFYYARIDTATKNFRIEASLSSCWNGVDGVQILNETFYSGTQVGGPTSNYQDFQSPKWFNGNAWSTISRPAGTTCDVPPPTSNQRCKWSTVTPNTWKSWDERF